MTLRVVVVDDSAFMRRAISQMLATDEQIQVVGTARNGREGLEMAKKLRPDVVTLDIEMPEMDGLTALGRIMRECPTQVLMVSSLTVEGSHAALRALKLGAADVLAKDTSQISLSITNIQRDLLNRVRTLARSRRPRPLTTGATARQAAANFRPGQFDVVCIGSSTGGPPVLETILASLPPSLATPIVVAQHMPPIFTASMAERLDGLCPLPVRYAQDGMPLERRAVYIAPGGKHLHIEKIGVARCQLRVSEQPREALYRPSVDVLLASAAQAMGSRALGIVLTGMGNDGFEGGKKLHGRGGTLLAQSEETCVVYGMPKGITENGLVAASLSPQGIVSSLCTLGEKSALQLRR